MDLAAIANSRHLWEPTIVRPSYWTANTPFIRWLISEIRPTTFVELGTEYGHSYLNIVDTILAFQKDAQCFAIDTWNGDSFTGEYDDSIYTDLKKFNSLHFQANSRLLRSTFQEALSSFEDESIDLLHIDGAHRYEDVLQDFADWAPKVKKNGFVLFHDIHVLDGEFGVHEFWIEIKKEFPNFELFSGFGLGILNFSKEPTVDLFQLNQEEKLKCVGVFETLGARYLKAIELGSQNELAQTQNELAQTQNELAQTKRLIESIQNSNIWKLTAIYRKPIGYLKMRISQLKKLGLLETLFVFNRSKEIKLGEKAFYEVSSALPELIYENRFYEHTNVRICVVVHAHYTELLDQIFSSLSSIPETFDLYVTTTHKIDLSKLQLKNCRNIRVYLVENRGRDILPFLSILKQIPIENYEFFLKLHTKLSPWIKDSDSNPMRMSSGNSWRDHFISSLVGDTKSVCEIIQQFEDSPKVALITAKNCLLDVSEVYGSNKVSVIKLMKRSKMYGLGAKFTFPAGSMYWAKANLVRKICEIPVTFAEFEDEKSQDDGTMAHAIERFIGVIVLHNEMINKEI